MFEDAMWQLWGENELVHSNFAEVVNEEFAQQIRHAAEKAKHKENEVREALSEVLAAPVKEWNELSK